MKGVGTRALETSASLAVSVAVRTVGFAVTKLVGIVRDQIQDRERHHCRSR